MGAQQHASDDGAGVITVRVDGRVLNVSQDTMTGREFRELAGLSGADDQDMYLEHPGIAEDTRIEDDEVLRIHDGMRFFTTPRAILMGSRNGCPPF
jgi:hypothetical protein